MLHPGINVTNAMMKHVKVVCAIVFSVMCLFLGAIYNGNPQWHVNTTDGLSTYPRNPAQNSKATRREQNNPRSNLIQEVISESDIESGADLVCSQESRVSLYKSVCSKYNFHSSKGSASTVLDPDRKLFGCIIGKAGSGAWRNFLAHSKTTKLNGTDLWTHPDQLRAVGLEYKGVPLNTITQYDDWAKYVTVRHPLQRLVSAYYHHAIRVNCSVEQENKSLTFLQFIQCLVSGELVEGHATWKLYTTLCLICDVDYQFIVKQETVDRDTDDFVKLFNLPKESSMTVVHTVLNKTKRAEFKDLTDTRYKYDNMWADLQDKHPELMRGILKIYALDMELFGYGWDWDQRKSYCADNSASGCC